MKRLSKKHNDFYSRMLAAKKAKAAKLAKEKEAKKVESNKPPTEKADIFSNIPKKAPIKVEVSASVSDTPPPSLTMQTSTTAAIENALRHIEQQAKGV